MATNRRDSPKKRMTNCSCSRPVVPPLCSLSHLPPSIPASSPHHLYVPQLHRQQTTVASLSPVVTALAKLAVTHLDNDLNSRPGLAAQQELSAIMDSISLEQSRGLVGVKFQKHIIAQAYTHWQLRPERRLLCFLQVEIKDVVLYPRDSSTCYVRFRDNSNGKDSSLKFTFVSENFQSMGFLSSKKIYFALKKLLVRILLSKEISSERLHFSCTDRKLEIALENAEGWVAEIVPCLVVKGTSSMFCCKPFPNTFLSKLPNSETLSESSSTTSTPRTTTTGEINLYTDTMSTRDSITSSPLLSPNEELSKLVSPVLDLGTLNEDERPYEILQDIVWYACTPKSESRLVKNIHRTDNGVRMSAMNVVHKLCQADWRLRDVSVYDVQTAMLHDADHQLDHSPRWQRETLEMCTRAILARLAHFAHVRYLPHFLLQDVNLWAHLPAKRFPLMSGAIDRLTSNDVALVSLVCRAGQFSLPTGIQIYSDFLTSSPRQIQRQQCGNYSSYTYNCGNSSKNIKEKYQQDKPFR